MTLFKPSIEVRHLLVLSRGSIAFEGKFHAGLNIIRGENSSGKSTLLDFLFFALGGDLTEWREAALECDEVLVEVALNGRVVTLSREVGTGPGRPMKIYPGDMNEAKADITGWALYPYSRFPQKESFSQVIFRWLGLPEVMGDAGSKLTVNQMLRLLYSDQITPIDRIFRIQRVADTGLIRQTVGDLLCGAFDDQLYKVQVREAQAKKEFEQISAELSSLFTALGSVKHSLTLDWISAEKSNIQSRIDSVQKEILSLEERIFHGEVSDGLSLKSQEEAYIDLQELQKNLAEKRKQLDDLKFEIEDSNLYIKDLEAKLAALNESAVTADLLKGISFMYCPACYATVDESDGFHCHLCKSPFDQERSQRRVLILINDVSQQIKQSEALQTLRSEELSSLERQVSEALSKWEAASRRYKLINHTPSTELRTKARELHREAGYLERQLYDLSEKVEFVNRIDALSNRKADLKAEISRLGDEIATRENAQKSQLSRAYTLIAGNVIDFLKKDLARQDTFGKAESIAFSFYDDRLSVNGESFFSASSMVYLRNSFLAAFWKSAMEDASFRHPRFAIFDTIEDKGMEPERSHNFQRILCDISEASSVSHQFIYATSMIAPELDDEKYVVGRFFTHENRTLAL